MAEPLRHLLAAWLTCCRAASREIKEDITSTIPAPPFRSNIENLTRSLANSRVDLNPHQVDAALFALRSPLSKGVILADEVGLGKTIEAGIVLTQRWAEPQACGDRET